MVKHSYRLSGGFFDREEEETQDVKRMVFLSTMGGMKEALED